MPHGIQTPIAGTHPSMLVRELSLAKAVGRLPLADIGNRPSQFPACQMTNVSGMYAQRAFGYATNKAFDVMSASLDAGAQPALSSADAQAVRRSMSWLDPNQPERFGNIVLGRFSALGTLHAAVTHLMASRPDDPKLIKCEKDLRKAIVNMAVSSGKCDRAPQGMSMGGASRHAAAELAKAGECLVKCVSSLDLQELVGGVVQGVLQESLTLAVGDRLGGLVKKLKDEGHTSLDVMSVLQGRAAEKIRAAAEHLILTGKTDTVQNGLLMLLKIPQIVVEGQPGQKGPENPQDRKDTQPPAVPRELLDRSAGAPILYNNSPTTVNNNFSDLVKALEGRCLDLNSVSNLLDVARRDAYNLGRAEERVDRLLGLTEDLKQGLDRKNGRIRDLEQQLAEKNAELSRWLKGGVDNTGVEKDLPPVMHAEQNEMRRESALFDFSCAGQPASASVTSEHVAVEGNVAEFQEEPAFEHDVETPVRVEVHARETVPNDEFESYVKELVAEPDDRSYGRSRSILSDGELVEARADLPNTTVNVADFRAFQRAGSIASSTSGSEPVSRRNSGSSRMSGSTSGVSVFDSMERVAGRRPGQRDPVAGTKPELQALFDAIKLKRASGEHLPLQAVVREKRGLNHSVGTQEAINQGDRILRDDWRARASSTTSLTSSQAEHLRDLTNVEPRPVDMERIRSFDVDALHARLWAAAERPESEAGDDMVVQKSMLSKSYFAASRDSGLDDTTGSEEAVSHLSSLERADMAKMSSITMSARLLAEIQEKRAALNSSAPFIVRSSSGKGWGVWPGQRP